MMLEQARGCFVTGTDTGVGKTLVSQVLLHALRRAHAAVAGFKPVASGCDRTREGLRNADALALQAASSIPLSYDTVNPYAFELPIAPHLAAEEAGVSIDLDAIVRNIESVAADRIVVEGVGGWLVPMNRSQSVADLAQGLGLPVVLVVGLRLGCLNHALLTADAIRSRGLELYGWVANRIDPAFERCDENIAALQERLDAPLLMRLPWFDVPPDPAELAVAHLR